ncbi:hypothetical protein LZ640_17165, partial [Aeromonas media]|uniref:hypothetical protein n=1 Tax=Aeromonas media TaxID=651 RepID=UPI001F1BAA0D
MIRPLHGGFTDLGHFLILAGVDALQKTVLAAVQHPIQHLDFLNATSHTSRSGYIFGSRYNRYHASVGWESTRCSKEAGVIAGEGACVFCYLLSDEAAEQEAGIINPVLGEQPCQRFTRDA